MAVDHAILDKIQKLLRLSENAAATPAEAAAAAGRAQALMEQHRISIAEVDAHGAEEPVFFDEHNLVWEGKRSTAWRMELASGLARANDCLAAAADRGRHRVMVRLAGRESDMAVVRYLFTYLSRQIDEAARVELKRLRLKGRAARRRWAENFRYGAVQMVLARIHHEKKKAREGVAARPECAGSAALVRLDRRRIEVERFAMNHFGPPTNVQAPSADHHGRSAGMQAGQSIPIHDAMSESAAVPALPKA